MRVPQFPLISVLLLVPALLLGALGQPEESRMPEEPPAAAEPLGVPGDEHGWACRRASEVIGLPVLDWDGREVGQGVDLAVELGSGLVRYVVFRFDRLPEAETEASYPVPLRYLQFDPDGGAVHRSRESAGHRRYRPGNPGEDAGLPQGLSARHEIPGLGS